MFNNNASTAFFHKFNRFFKNKFRYITIDLNCFVLTKRAKTKKQKSIQQKKIIKANLVKIMDQIDAQVKDIGKNLQVKNVIKLQAMMDNSKLDLYQKEFYKPQDIYMQQLNIQDNRQLYANVSLDTYIQNDKIGNKTKVLNQIRQEKQKLLIELDMLKNG